MAHLLSEEELAHFHEFGFIVKRGLLTPAEVTAPLLAPPCAAARRD